MKAASGVIRARYAVVATNSSDFRPFCDPHEDGPYRTYVITFEIQRGDLPDALYWDTEDPYHYVRLQLGPSRTDLPAARPIANRSCSGGRRRP